MPVSRLLCVLVPVVVAFATLVGCSETSAPAASQGVAPPSVTSAQKHTVLGATYCPLAGEFPTKPRLASASARLVPFTPTRADLCLIDRGNDGANTAAEAVLIDSAAQRLADLLNSAKQSPFAHGAFSCPADFATGLRADFTDAAGRHLEVFVADSGCAAARNGAFIAAIPSGLSNLLANLAPQLPTFTIR